MPRRPAPGRPLDRATLRRAFSCLVRRLAHRGVRALIYGAAARHPTVWRTPADLAAYDAALQASTHAHAVSRAISRASASSSPACSSPLSDSVARAGSPRGAGISSRTSQPRPHRRWRSPAPAGHRQGRRAHDDFGGHLVEINPPADEKAVQWYLLTSMEVGSAEAAQQRVEHYLQR